MPYLKSIRVGSHTLYCADDIVDLVKDILERVPERHRLGIIDRIRRTLENISS